MMCLIAGRASLECQMSSFWPRRNFLVGMVSFWYRFYKSKNGGLTRFGWAPTWRPQTQIFLHYLVQTYLRAQKVSFFLATVSFFYKSVLTKHIFHHGSTFFRIKRSTVIL